MIYRTNITRKIRTESEINNNTDMWILSMLFHLWHQYIVEFSLCNMKGDETWSSDQLLNYEIINSGFVFFSAIVERRKQANEDCKPIDMESLNKARENRMMEIKMETVLREIAIYIVFVLVLFFLSYQQRDSNSYQMAENLKAFFDNGFTNVS